ncbi:LPXTG-motif cell wall anchor domain-containing protein [Seinonella peptonophila]|uniref:LPXTG-motif cell wall anchor domain-containing protein n=1 Tax=Seinonella peptonophila TaxID=112248 RepID=A0A1M4X506_9BACL|nr:LPXTG cell wall anchor domain-containing protein [Seinonella peptonophila]SHE88588.1 LPXTG-motif cell wall anchor domain-containing protein [Seinonella peptonophila]
MKKTFRLLTIFPYLLTLLPIQAFADDNQLPNTATDYPNMVLIGASILILGILLLGWLWWRDRY